MKAAVFALLLGSDAARFKRSSAKTIEGVSVHNYREGVKEWIVLFKKGTSQSTVKSVCAGKCTLQGHLVPFASFKGDEEAVGSMLRGHADVAEVVEPEATDFAIPEIPSKARALASWGLDTIGVAGRANTGKGVHVYVQDTGIRVTHTDYGGRAVAAYDLTIDEQEGIDCGSYSGPCGGDVQGHGSHCAGTAAGSTYGVAPDAQIYAVKSLSDKGKGLRSWQLGGIDWTASFGNKPAVLSMSLGGPGRDRGFELAIDEAVAAGVIVVVAAGNSNTDACQFLPASVPSAITVGATDSTNRRAGYSNYGECNDIMAPGSEIMSADVEDGRDDGGVAYSGTSMACPHVSGAAALLLESHPTWKSDEVLAEMKKKAARYMIQDLRFGDPDEFLWVSAEDAPTFPKPPNRFCPAFAKSREPDAQGDCECPDWMFCSMDGEGWDRDCVNSEGGVGWYGGRFFLVNCEHCRCYYE